MNVRSVRILSKIAMPKRFMSGHSTEEAKAEAQKWLKFTIGMVGLSTIFMVYNYATLTHDHQEKNDLPYQKIRNKPFPWSCSNCDLFDTQCWKECKDAKKAEKSESH